MNISVILGHPDPGSFNHAIARTVVAQLEKMGCRVFFHDLYAEGFDPVLPATEIPKNARLPDVVADMCRELSLSHGVVVVHPNWWGMPPALLKGWVDRVMRCGVAYAFEETDSGEGVPLRLLTRLTTAVVFNTGNTPIQREKEVFGDPLERIWRDCIFGLCGRADFHRRYFTVVCTADDARRKAWLEEARHLVRDLFSGHNQSTD